jgi:hypothetical protein
MDIFSFQSLKHQETDGSNLAGDTRWHQFFQSEANAVVLQQTMIDLGLRPYIRRFKREAGCTLLNNSKAIIEILFESMIVPVNAVAILLARDQE